MRWICGSSRDDEAPSEHPSRREACESAMTRCEARGGFECYAPDPYEMGLTIYVARDGTEYTVGKFEEDSPFDIGGF